MTETPVRDWVAPQLRAMIEEGVKLGFDAEAVTAVITDLITGPDFNHAPLPAEPLPPAVPPGAVPSVPDPDYTAPSLGNVGDWFHPETNF